MPVYILAILHIHLSTKHFLQYSIKSHSSFVELDMNSLIKRTQILTSFSLQLHFLLFLFISITQCPLASHGYNEQERRALLDFKFSMEDPANRLSSWLEGNKYRNCCNWHGIECSKDSSPHVISINLRNTVLETYINEYFKDDFNIRGPTPNTSLHG
ncbi:probably inactive leucine-rich repeat receptor-like protein kinase At5g06940 [Papaver somniferum]|uniref:probably inactive leucine-rich repeat receptor-like protein kinase At5g06940 n=1 Tax=Papaver somniferum TaxID=3469 RepID=UPI000E6FF90D|nr:probably inactive leucine-rich repeat receptor-like protein kinase At5g06940 [Papaver somniferum]